DRHRFENFQPCPAAAAQWHNTGTARCDKRANIGLPTGERQARMRTKLVSRVIVLAGDSKPCIRDPRADDWQDICCEIGDGIAIWFIRYCATIHESPGISFL